MFELGIKILGYLPYEFLWIYIVFLIVLFVLLIRIIVRILGGI